MQQEAQANHRPPKVGPQSSMRAQQRIALTGDEAENNHHNNDTPPEMDPLLEKTDEKQPLRLN